VSVFLAFLECRHMFLLEGMEVAILKFYVYDRRTRGLTLTELGAWR